ncbi:MAG: tRNA preQ1(34) S-adenosylmethionine ribosyltransferase-isomerase QueA [Chloroflexi bacterium]|nr:tRNA preQ1(34) S-adenosylmethionine ribosyltransferase-isomerase QueA [Chloroflexota bacterium]
MKVSEFDYELPQELIAQHPLEPRDSSRLMAVDRDAGAIEHRHFRDILGLLHPNDLLVANDSRVMPARLRGRKPTGARIEVLLLRRISPERWEALVKPSRRVQPGSTIMFDGGEDSNHVQALVGERTAIGSRFLDFAAPLDPLLPRLGEVPLPPYIHSVLADPERYQTVYAREQGSAAAPTAGLHFTPELLEEVRSRGVKVSFVTLHIGIDTFRPLITDNVEDHDIHTEWYYVPPATLEEIRLARERRGRIIAVGTTAVRVLETVADGRGLVRTEMPPADCSNGLSGWTKLYIYPGYSFRMVDAMITNFHLPRSSLVLLVSAFAGRDLIRRAYAEAIREKYRFFSFGDAMFIA